MIDQIKVVATQLSARRLAVTGVFVAFIVFIVCWGAAGLGLVASHTFVGLFTLAPVASSWALVVGGVGAAGSGALIGALVAVGYNLTGRFFVR